MVGFAERRLRASFVYGVLLAAAAIFLLPVFWTISSSFKTLPEFASGVLFPAKPDGSNYQQALTLIDFFKFTGNSLVLGVLFTGLVVFSSALAGYGFARHPAPGRNALFLLVLATMMVPPFVTFVPQFVLFSRLELTNTYWPWILWGLAGSPFHIFLFRQFFANFPRELEDAAEVDGCGPLRIFWAIFLPNAGPAIAASAIFAFTWVWGDYLFPILLLSQDNTTLAVAMANGYRDPFGNPYMTVTMAGVALYSLPLILVFFFAQRLIIQGIVTTGLRR
jgi:ABC-type glycerol-3-phosphate transport system permease component